jgi:hypothetical protein
LHSLRRAPAEAGVSARGAFGYGEEVEVNKVISRKQLPTNLPTQFTLLMWLVLDKLDSPGWVWGVVGTLVAILWASAIHAMYTQEPTRLKELE